MLALPRENGGLRARPARTRPPRECSAAARRRHATQSRAPPASAPRAPPANVGHLDHRDTGSASRSCLAVRAQGDFRPDELEEFKEAFALFDDSGAGAIEVRARPRPASPLAIEGGPTAAVLRSGR